MRTAKLLAGIVPFLLFGCGDDLFAPISGTYVLREVDGRSVPAEVEVEGIRYTILADTLILSDARWRRRMLFLEWVEPTLVLRDFATDGFLTESPEGVVLDFECPDLASCIAPSVFRVVGDGLRIERNSHPPVPGLVFEPLP